MNLLPADPESEALVTDRYLDAILSAHERGADDAPADPDVDPRVRLAARRLSRELGRVHPSFRFEERLAARLAETAARMRLEAADGVGQVVTLPSAPLERDAGAPSLAAAAATRRANPTVIVPRPLLIGVTSAALSLAGAAYVAWRRGRPSATASAPPGSAGAMARAAGRSGGPSRRLAGEGRLMPINLPFRPRRDTYPPDLWTKCPGCGEMLFNKQLDRTLRVCPNCGHHFRVGAKARLEQILDAGSFVERDPGLESIDALGFVDSKPYPDRLAAARMTTGLHDAAIWGVGAIEGRRVSLCALDFGFMGGSMGSVVGEKVTRAAEAALAGRIPLIVVSSSGGARMQEGTLSLMQLVKTLAAVERLRTAGVPFISVLSDPTTGGVFASFAAVGDVNIAEPNALIGFAGARVSAGTIAEELPEGFQRAEFLLSHGFVDRIVARADLRGELARLLRYLVPDGSEPVAAESPSASPFRPLSFLTALAERVVPDGRATPPHDAPEPMTTLPDAPTTPGDADPAEVEARVWARVQLARNLRRPRTLELLETMAEDVVELHGDRLFGDDAAIVAGFARIDGRRVAVVGHQKGAETEENIRRNFGMPHPEGYRKAMRVMELAERFRLPVVTLIDVPGAYPGAESEERGIAEAIARSIGLMTRLRTPIVAVITGEGGSGGALAVAVGDVVVALENAVYSVISPEGCASILWRSPDMAPTAAVAMRMTAADQLELGVVDIVVPEPGEGAHTDHAETARRLRTVILQQLEALSAPAIEELLDLRYARYRTLGAFTEVSAAPAPRPEPGLVGRLRALVEAGRQTLAVPIPVVRPEPGRRPRVEPPRVEPPAREEV